MQSKRLWLILVALLLLVAAPAAYAQDGDSDKFVFGEDYVLRAGEILPGNLAVVRGTATIEAGSIVGGDVAVLGGQLNIAGTVTGNVAILGGSVSLADTAVVEGDLASFGASVDRAPGAQLRGETLGGPQLPEDIPLPEIETPRSGAGSVVKDWILWQLRTLGSGLLMALLGVVAVALAPKAMGRMATAVARQPAMSFGIGLLTLALGILGGAALLIACGLGLLVWLALSVALLVGWLAVGLWAGQRLLAALRMHTASSLVEVALGVFGITVLGSLPWCIGFLFSAIVGAIGLGAVVLTRVGSQLPEGPTEPPSGAVAEPAVPLLSPSDDFREPPAAAAPVSAPDLVGPAVEALPEPGLTPPDEPTPPADVS